MFSSLSIVIPAYNEEARLGDTLNKISAFLSKYVKQYEIIVVDDGSTDGTPSLLQKSDIPYLHVIKYSKNRGKGYAVKKGMLAARYDWILFSDADLSTSIEELQNFAKSQENHSVIIASRGLKGAKITQYQPFYRIFAGKCFNLAVRMLAVPGIRDTQCGFKLFSREAAHKIFSRQTIEGFGFDVEALFLARKHGFAMKELPVEWKNAEGSKVKFLRHGTRMLLDILRIRMNDLFGKY